MISFTFGTIRVRHFFFTCLTDVHRICFISPHQFRVHIYISVLRRLHIAFAHCACGDVSLFTFFTLFALRLRVAILRCRIWSLDLI